MTNIKIKYYAIFIIGLLIVLLFGFSGKFLIVDEQPVKSDVIIVLGGDIGRIEKGVALYHEGLAPYIMVSDGGSRNHPSTAEADKMIKKAKELGVPSSAIIQELRSQSTYGNAVYSLDLSKSHNFHSALIVSSDYHMLRTKLTYEHIFSNSGIRLTYCAAESSFKPDFNLIDTQTTKFKASEYIKLIGYMVYYHI
jgi:uncharacterized SAM-binding protein YcdF (DUF218 family)